MSLNSLKFLSTLKIILLFQFGSWLFFTLLWKSLITSLLSGISSCSGPLTYISCPRPGISHFSSNYNRPLAIGLCEFHSRFSHTFRNICWLCGRFSGLADDLASQYCPPPPSREVQKQRSCSFCRSVPPYSSFRFMRTILP